MRMGNRHHFTLRREFPSLRRVGVAVAHFPRYHNPQRTNDLTHDVLYLSFLMRGKVMHHVADQAGTEEAMPEEAGTVTVVTYGTSHEIVTGSQHVEVFNLYLDPQRHPLPHVPAALAPHLARLLPLHAGIVNNLNRLVRVVLPDPQRTARWLTAIVNEQREDGPGTDACLQALLQLVVIDLARAASAAAPSARLQADPALERAAHLISERFGDHLTVADLAAAAGLSPWHFTRQFTLWAGRSPMRCLRDRRIQETMSRLRTTEQRVLDIAVACGFRDLAHFNRTFKQVADCTPRDYRRRLSLGSPRE